eukprot:gene26211-34290_t
MASPKATSTSSMRKMHQHNFKQRLIERYKCSDPTNRDIIKCMVTGHYFSKNNVVAGHIISLDQMPSLAAVGLSMDKVYDEKNGILWYEEIEKKYSSQQLTLLYDRNTHLITIQILYDALLTERIGTLTKKVMGLPSPSDDLLYSHINNRPISLPNLVFPYRRAIMWVAKHAYQIALASPVPHICATNSNPTDIEWSETFNSLNDSIGFFGSAFQSSLEIDNISNI